MPFFSKKADQWVVLDDQKNVLFSDPDRETALAYFKRIATKPENTCPHRLTIRKTEFLRQPLVASTIHECPLIVAGRALYTHWDENGEDACKTGKPIVGGIYRIAVALDEQDDLDRGEVRHYLYCQNCQKEISATKKDAD